MLNKTENNFWVDKYNSCFSEKAKNDLFLLEVVCYHPFTYFFKKEMSFLEIFLLNRLIKKHGLTFANKTLLDIGCGGGRLSYFFANKQAKVTGVDYVDNVIERNKRMYKNISFEKMDVCNLRFDDGQFHFVNAFVVLQHILNENKIKALNEMSRILNKDGFMFILESHPSNEQAPENSKAILTREEWRELLKAYNLEVVEEQPLHYYPLFLAYKRIVPNLYRFLRIFAKTNKCGKNSTDQRLGNQAKKSDTLSLKQRIVQAVNSAILNFIAIPSFLVELFLITLKFKGGSHTLFLIQKRKALFK